MQILDGFTLFEVPKIQISRFCVLFAREIITEILHLTFYSCRVCSFDSELLRNTEQKVTCVQDCTKASQYHYVLFGRKEILNLFEFQWGRFFRLDTFEIEDVNGFPQFISPASCLSNPLCRFSFWSQRHAFLIPQRISP